MAAILKIYFLLLLTERPIDFKLGRSIGVTCRSKIALKSFRSEIQVGRHSGHLENLFFASSPELISLLTLNLVGLGRVTCRSKIAKIYFSLLLLNQRAY